MKKALNTRELRQNKPNRHEFENIPRNKIVLFLDRLLNNILELADHPIHIPMGGMANFLNVATATAVVVFDMIRRQQS